MYVEKVETKEKDKDGKLIRIYLEVDFIASLGSKNILVLPVLPISNREKEILDSCSPMKTNDSFKKVIIVKNHVIQRCYEEGILTTGIFDFFLKGYS